MQIRRSLALTQHDMRILLRDPATLVILIGMPLVLMAFVKPAFRSTFITAGDPRANGAEQAVPGMTVMFAFFIVGTVGFSFFREHGWNTWDRLRATRSNPIELIVGKTIPLIVISMIQLTVLLGLGGILFRLHLSGSPVAIAVVALALALCLVAFGVMLVALLKTMMQLSVISDTIALTAAGIGGAITPISLLPEWAQKIAPIAPSYWAMRGFQEAILHQADVMHVLFEVGVLLSYTTLFTTIALLRFRTEEIKRPWA